MLKVKIDFNSIFLQTLEKKLMEHQLNNNNKKNKQHIKYISPPVHLTRDRAKYFFLGGKN